jgi:hypothetical protein
MHVMMARMTPAWILLGEERSNSARTTWWHAEDAAKVPPAGERAADSKISFTNMNSSLNIIKKKRTTGVPKFLRHLYSILTHEDPSIISWSVDGMSIQLFDVQRLEREVLPKYFKHNKLSSFQRQLNYFGFRKWTKTQSSVCTFSHADLNRHATPDTMPITRKHPTTVHSESDDDVSMASVDDLLLDMLPLEPVDLKLDDWELKLDDWDLCVESFDVHTAFDWAHLDAPVCVFV